MNKIVEQPKRAKENMDWFYNNIGELKRFFAGQWVAVDKGKAVASSNSFRDLIKKLQKLPKEARELAFVEFVHKKEPYLIFETA